MSGASVSAVAALYDEMQAVTAGHIDSVMAERGRGFASDREAWAELKARLETAAAAEKNVDKLHKEMWDEVKKGNSDAVCIIAQEIERAAEHIAQSWVEVAAMARISVEMTEE